MHTGLPDHPGRVQGRRHISGAAQHVRLAYRRRDFVHAIHAVLQRQDHRPVRDEGRKKPERLRIVVGLDRKQHDVNGPDLARSRSRPMRGRRNRRAARSECEDHPA